MIRNLVSHLALQWQFCHVDKKKKNQLLQYFHNRIVCFPHIASPIFHTLVTLLLHSDWLVRSQCLPIIRQLHDVYPLLAPTLLDTMLFIINRLPEESAPSSVFIRCLMVN